MFTLNPRHIALRAAVFALALFLVGCHDSQCEASRDSLAEEVQELRTALRQANENIEEANSAIENAKLNAWSSYQDMGDALEALDTVEEVPDP